MCIVFIRVAALRCPYLHVNVQHTDHSFLSHCCNRGFAASMGNWRGKVSSAHCEKHGLV